MAATTSKIFALGNPLLDISIADGEALLEKYELEANNAILAEEKHVPMYAEMLGQEGVELSAGGATLNSVRVAQWCLEEEATTFAGCVGKDENGEKLATACNADKVDVKFMKDESTPTGTCACVITQKGKARSLVANLAAANNYAPTHLHEDDVWSAVTDASIFYSAGFHLTVSPDAMLDLARHASENGKTFAMNLSAPFLPEFFKDQMMQVMPFTDILLGNESEAETFARVHEFEEQKDLVKIATAIAALPKVNEATPRTVIITCGADHTIVVVNGEATTYPVDKLDADKIVDTNGAGDAFVGGFLAGLAQAKDMAACVADGHAAAKMIIQISGVVLPAKE